MSPDLRQALRVLAEQLPPGSAVPVPREALLRLLEDGARALQDADWTVKRLAERWDRKPGTVRLWMEQGRIPGAYRFKPRPDGPGREWRVPHDRLAEYEESQRQQQGTVLAVGGDAGATGDWRNHLPKAS